MPPSSDSGAYDAAGVHIGVTETALQSLTARLRRTWPTGRAGATGVGGVALDFGYYANVIDIGGGMGMAISTDGVGSKALIAEMLGKYDTIGIDCVAMNVNDVICVGARPLTLVDYVAVERVDPVVMAAIAEGLAVGAERAGVSISGGEIAELPDMIKGHNKGTGFDLAGTAAGIIRLDRIIVGRDCKLGDAVVGIQSSGIHSNGLTLARKVLLGQAKLKVGDRLADVGRSVGEELLEPTLIYVAEAMAMLEQVPGVRALAHITGGGFLNLVRVPVKVGFLLDALPPPPPVFQAIAARGAVPAADMYTVFNMGVGLCVVVAEADVARVVEIARQHGKKAARIGSATNEPGVVRIPHNAVSGTDLAGEGRFFRQA
ncbi:MAG: phosphoribosylformylglycinamidine cyclo-ligase [Alphaproteobacteria bacterium]|nr:phosphoribosylformylglycinamidine cyclo-ligase [Alphaproteobacteria bacterium]